MANNAVNGVIQVPTGSVARPSRWRSFDVSTRPTGFSFMAQVVSTIFQFGKKNFVEDIVTHTDVNPPLEISFIIEAD